MTLSRLYRLHHGEEEEKDGYDSDRSDEDEIEDFVWGNLALANILNMDLPWDNLWDYASNFIQDPISGDDEASIGYDENIGYAFDHNEDGYILDGYWTDGYGVDNNRVRGHETDDNSVDGYETDNR